MMLNELVRNKPLEYINYFQSNEYTKLIPIALEDMEIYKYYKTPITKI
jgi:hypothetical protein